MVKLELLEGYMVELRDKSIWEVKGFTHPLEGVVCYPRYLVVKGRIVKVASLREKIETVKSKYKKYLKSLSYLKSTHPLIPLSDIVKVYSPISKSREILKGRVGDEVEETAKQFLEELVEAGVSRDKIGITGSILPRLHTKTSDVDVIVYGLENSEKAYSKLEEMKSSGEIKPLHENYLREKLKLKSIDTPECLEHFENKVLEGIYKNRVYTVKLTSIDSVLRPKDFYVVERFNQKTYKVRVVASENHYTIPWPARVRIVEGFNEETISRIYTLRTRFTELYREGLKLEVRGSLEKTVFRGEEFYQISINSLGDYVCLDV